MMQPAPAAEREGMSLDDFLERAHEAPLEIINGKARLIVSTGKKHSDITHIIYDAIRAFSSSLGLGVVRMETTFIRPDTDDPQWVKGSRIPDVMYFAPGRFEAYSAQETDEYRPIALIPDLVVEVVSPRDTHIEVEEKIDAYLADGVRLIWLINPKQRKVTLYAPDFEQPIVLKGNAVLDGGDVLPGFQLPLMQLFA